MTSTTFFIIFIPILAILLLAINLILAPHNPYQEKDSVFECGFHSFLGQNRTQFSVSFFIFGLLFLLFDLEILLVYPYSVSSYTNDIYGLVVMMVFFVLLTLGFIFELGKNALTIDSRQTSSYSNNDTTTPVVFISKDSSLHSSVILTGLVGVSRTQANIVLFFLGPIITLISSFLALFGTYKHNTHILISSPLGVETMLNIYPAFKDWIIIMADIQKVNSDVWGVLSDISFIKKDIEPVVEAINNNKDPDIIQKASQFTSETLRYKFVWNMNYPTYHYFLGEILLNGWKVEYILEHFDAILTNQQKVMLGVLQDTIVYAKQDLSTYYANKIPLYEKLSETNHSDLMKEVNLLLQNNPFNKAL